MPDYFVFKNSITDFLFYGWNSASAPGLIGMCSFSIAFVLLLEICRTAQLYCRLQGGLSAYALTRPDSSISARRRRAPLLRSMVIPPSMAHIKRRKVLLHFLGALTNILLLCLGYILMLAVMKYNAWIFVSVILASGVFYHLFEPVRQSFAEKIGQLSLMNGESEEESDGEILDFVSEH